MHVPPMTPTDTAAHASTRGWTLSLPCCLQPAARIVQRDVRAADRRRARATVGLQDVAVERDLHLAEGRAGRSPPAGCGRSAAGSRACARSGGPWPLPGRPARGSIPGSSEYSAVTQPRPLPRIHRGTSSSTLAVHSTRVRPAETSTLPAAITVKSRSKLNGRRSSAPRPSLSYHHAPDPSGRAYGARPWPRHGKRSSSRPTRPPRRTTCGGASRAADCWSGKSGLLPTHVPPAAVTSDALFLGVLDGHPCWAADAGPEVEAPEGFTFMDLRALHPALGEQRWAIAGRAVQLVDWLRCHQYCGRCATPTEALRGERARRCPSCGLLAFPRLAPAVITLVQRGDEALLAQGVNFGVTMYSCLAGFVEPGETLEEAVRARDPGGGRRRGRRRAVHRQPAVAVPPLADDRVPRRMGVG